MIILDSIIFFVDDVFFYLRSLALTYVSTNRYVFDWENHVSAKQQLARTLVLNYMIHVS